MCKKLTILHTKQNSIYGLRLEIWYPITLKMCFFVILITHTATVYWQGKLQCSPSLY